MKLGTPKGTRDFLPVQARKRNYIFEILKQVFEQFGYAPIETPAMELTETLLGKYGDEGDRLIFKILARGEKLEKSLQANTIEAKNLAEEALRYDLTVPFARMVVQHQNEIAFPFKRYQIQPVWRADRPQKGRYREFFQCDIDVIGSTALCNEVELLQMAFECFSKLGLADVEIQLNNRKILQAIAIKSGLENRFVEITVAIDKVDKIGLEGVVNELSAKDFSPESIEKLKPFLVLEGSNEKKLDFLEKELSAIEIGRKGLDELNFVLKFCPEIPVKVNLSLARGLNYYTGCIIEVTHKQFNSSICGGGRYDDLTGIFGMRDVSGVGISFGADRIFDLMEEMNLFPEKLNTNSDLIFLNFGVEYWSFAQKMAKELRAQGLNIEVYPDEAKLKKQMKFANDKKIPLVALIGENEIINQQVQLKNMITGAQSQVPFNEFITEVKKQLKDVRN